jgi:hypothetical protein
MRVTPKMLTKPIPVEITSKCGAVSFTPEYRPRGAPLGVVQ